MFGKAAAIAGLALATAGAFVFKETYAAARPDYAKTELAHAMGWAALGLYLFLALYPLRKFFIFLFSPRLKSVFLAAPDRFAKEYQLVRDEIIKLEYNKEALSADEVERRFGAFLKRLAVRRYFQWRLHQAPDGHVKIELWKRARSDSLGNFLFLHSMLGLLMGIVAYLHFGSTWNTQYVVFAWALYAAVFSGLVNYLFYAAAPRIFRRLELRAPFNKSVFTINKLVIEIVEAASAAGGQAREWVSEGILAPLSTRLTFGKVWSYLRSASLFNATKLRARDVSSLDEGERQLWARLVEYKAEIDAVYRQLIPFRFTQFLMDAAIFAHALASAVLVSFIAAHLYAQLRY